MRIQFSVNGLPPKKDGANSMWRKPSELARLKALRLAALEAVHGDLHTSAALRLHLRIYAPVSAGDLDNFITGICDGLMAAHPATPIDPDSWRDVPTEAQPHKSIVYTDDGQIMQIIAERIVNDGDDCRYEVRLEAC